MPALNCPKCGSQIPVSISDAGQQIRCPTCQATFRIKAKANSAASPGGRGAAPAPAAARSDIDDGYGLAPSNDLKPTPAPQTRVAERAAPTGPSLTQPEPAAKPQAALPGYVVPLAIGGVLVSVGMLAALAFATYSLLGGDGDDQVTDNIANNVANNTEKAGQPAAQPALIGGDWPIATAAARPAAADHSLPPSLELSAIDWRVTPDDGTLKRDELKPLTLMNPPMGPSAMHFHRDEPGVVSLVGRVQMDQGWLTWATYDLRTGEKLRSVELVTLAENDLNSAQPFFAVNNDGNWLLFGNGYLRLEVWNAAGEKKPLERPTGTERARWARFLTNDRIAVVCEQKLYECVLPAGEFVEKGPAPLGPIHLSANRKWASYFVDDGFSFFQLPEWTPAGKLPLPQGVEYKPEAPPDGSFSRDGKGFAVAIPQGEWNHLLTWDVASGKLTDVVSLQPSAFHRIIGSVEWLGPRMLLVGGAHAVDLDVKASVWNTSGGSRDDVIAPDGRLWGANPADQYNLSKLWSMVSKDPVPPYDPLNKPTPSFITPTTWPSLKAMARIVELKKLQPWLVLSRPVRAEVQSDEEGFRSDAAEQWGTALATNGFPIDPKAPLALRLRLEPANVALMSVSQVISATTAMNTGVGRVFARASAKLDLVDASGKVLWTGGEITGESPIGPEADMQKLRQQWPEVPEYTSFGPPGFDIRPRNPKESQAARDELMKKLPTFWPKFFPDGRVPDALVIDTTALDFHDKPVRLPLHDQITTLDVLEGK